MAFLLLCGASHSTAAFGEVLSQCTHNNRPLQLTLNEPSSQDRKKPDWSWTNRGRPGRKGETVEGDGGLKI